VTPQSPASAGSGGAAKAAAPAPQQQAQGNGEQPQLIFSPWVKLLQQGRRSKAKKGLCHGQDAASNPASWSSALRSSRWMASEEASAHEPALWRQSEYGTRLIVARTSDDRAVRDLPEPVVPPGGCIADYDATAT